MHCCGVAELAGQARQARRLTLRVLVVALGAVVTRFGVVLVFVLFVDTEPAFGAIFAFDSCDVAVLAGAARRALGAAFRIRRLTCGTVETGCCSGNIANFSALTDFARNQPFRVCEFARNARQTLCLTFTLLVTTHIAVCAVS